MIDFEVAVVRLEEFCMEITVSSTKFDHDAFGLQFLTGGRNYHLFLVVVVFWLSLFYMQQSYNNIFSIFCKNNN